jgi:hypothetical protein
MNFLDFIFTGCFPSAPKLPEIPDQPEPLPQVDEEDKARKERMQKLSSKRKGHGSLITNTGGAAGLQEDDGSAVKQKLGGS